MKARRHLTCSTVEHCAKTTESLTVGLTSNTNGIESRILPTGEHNVYNPRVAHGVVMSSGVFETEASIMSSSTGLANGRTEHTCGLRNTIVAADHVYIFDVSENASCISGDTFDKSLSVAAPGRGGDRDRIKRFETGVTVGKHVDRATAILDNFCLENLDVTTEDTCVGTDCNGSGKITPTVDRKEVTCILTPIVLDVLTASAVGKGYEDH